MGGPLYPLPGVPRRKQASALTVSRAPATQKARATAAPRTPVVPGHAGTLRFKGPCCRVPAAPRGFPSPFQRRVFRLLTRSPPTARSEEGVETREAGPRREPVDERVPRAAREEGPVLTRPGPRGSAWLPGRRRLAVRSLRAWLPACRAGDEDLRDV